jgi:tRNA G10  N-methylase Trm11/alkylated DNA repair dioxygenase AlkB
MDDYVVAALVVPCVFYDESFLNESEANQYYETLLNDTPWEKTAKINRWVCLYEQENADTQYQYRDAPTQQKRPFTDSILAIKEKVENWTNIKNNKHVSFNVCLLNFYEDGNQRIGWHTDREEIGRDTPIASVSLGATRDFMLRAKEGYDKTTISMASGSLVIMENACQLKYLHSVPKQSNVTDGRINLTFRCKTAHTSGEEEHERRDKWLERMTDIVESAQDNQPYDMEYGTLMKTYVFGDGIESIPVSKEEVVYLVKTNIGAECYTAAEILEVLDATMWRVAPKPWETAGYVALIPIRCASESPLSELLELRSAHHVLQFHDCFDLSDIHSNTSAITGEQLYQFYKQRLVDQIVDIPCMHEKVHFRVSCERIGGPHGFRAPEVEFEVGGALSEFYENIKPKMEDYDVEIRVDVIGHKVVIGTQVNVGELSRRHFARFRNGVTIKCNLAYILLRCANIRPGNLIIDPFCGSGTILLEALETTHKRVRCIGLDISRRSAKGARENADAANYGPDLCEIHCADARAIRKYVKNDSVDAIVTNLPWGVMTGNKNVSDLQSMYEIFLRTAWYVLKDKGRIVMFVLRGLQLTRIIRKLSGRYRLLRCNVIRTTNNLPCIVVVEKLAIDELNNSIKGQLAYLSEFVNVSKEMYHAIHMEDIDGNESSNKNQPVSDRELSRRTPLEN